MLKQSSLAIKPSQVYLPHRYPFLLVDKVLEIVPGEKIIAIKNVTINEPFFQGHFPEEPIMPGVLIVEAMAQVSSILANHMNPFRTPVTNQHVLAALDRIKFKRPVVPGDQLQLTVIVRWKRNQFTKYQAQATVNDQVVCTAEITSAIKGDR
jgi:3-hydroxyacyl-[acyl-carrier-protein] dehydratase